MLCLLRSTSLPNTASNSLGEASTGLAPGVGVYPNTEFIFDGGVGARFYVPIAGSGHRYSSPEPDPY